MHVAVFQLFTDLQFMSPHLSIGRAVSFLTGAKILLQAGFFTFCDSKTVLFVFRGWGLGLPYTYQLHITIYVNTIEVNETYTCTSCNIHVDHIKYNTCNDYMKLYHVLLRRHVMIIKDTFSIVASYPHARNQYNYIFTSLAKEVMFLVALVCLFVCLSVSGQHYSKRYERTGMKFYNSMEGSWVVQ